MNKEYESTLRVSSALPPIPAPANAAFDSVPTGNCICKQGHQPDKVSVPPTQRFFVVLLLRLWCVPKIFQSVLPGLQLIKLRAEDRRLPIPKARHMYSYMVR